MGGIEVGVKGCHFKLLNGLNIHMAPGPDGLSAGVVEGCISENAPVLACICGGSLVRGAVLQANVTPVLGGI